MGLDQWILRADNDNVEPSVNQENGEWMNAKQVLQLRKEYWLHNRIMELGIQKLKKPIDDLNCVMIPLRKEELQNILEDSKTCVSEKSNYLIDEYFDYYPISTSDTDWVIEGMKIFNKTISNALRSKNENYYYTSWW